MVGILNVNAISENLSLYKYDRGGNITAKKRYAYTTGMLGSVQQTISYTYGDSNWKDKLTKYNGTSLSYDAQGT